MTQVSSQISLGHVVGQIAEAQTLLAELITQTGRRLDSAATEQSRNLSVNEMARRVGEAIAALKGDVPTSLGQTLRGENRIQDNPEILSKLGFKGKLPVIPRELIEECARTSGTLVLKFKTTLLDYQSALNTALGSEKEHLCLSYIDDRAKGLASTNKKPVWINVPNTVREETLRKPKAKALDRIQGSD